MEQGEHFKLFELILFPLWKKSKKKQQSILLPEVKWNTILNELKIQSRSTGACFLWIVQNMRSVGKKVQESERIH